MRRPGLDRRIPRMARTIADLEAKDVLTVGHLAEAINYRSLDRERGN